MSDAGGRSFWRFVFLSAIAAVVLLALTIACILVTNRQSWEATRSGLLARGERLSLTDFAPEPVPPDQNFYGAEIWTEVTGRIAGVTGTPRVPRGKRRLDVLHRTASKEEKERLKGMLPASMKHLPDNMVSLRSQAATSLAKTDDPARRRELANFILETLRDDGPVLAEISALLDRPAAVAAIDYTQNFSVPLDHISYILDISRTWESRALASLALGHSQAAAADIRGLFRLAGTMREEPLLICLLVRTTSLLMADRTIRAGFDSWSEVELTQFEEELRGVDLIADLQRCLRGERGAFNDFVDGVRSGRIKPEIALAMGAFGGSSNLAEQAAVRAYVALSLNADRAKYNRLTQSWIDALESARKSGLVPGDFEQVMPGDLTSLLRQEFLTNSLESSIPGAIAKIAITQCNLAMTRIACALERYRRVRGELPETLAALAPDFLPEIPRDVIGGGAFHYRKEGADGFRLWSVGWDAKDGGGVSSRSRGATSDGDWVWGEEPGAKK